MHGACASRPPTPRFPLLDSLHTHRRLGETSSSPQVRRVQNRKTAGVGGWEKRHRRDSHLAQNGDKQERFATDPPPDRTRTHVHGMSTRCAVPPIRHGACCPLGTMPAMSPTAGPWLCARRVGKSAMRVGGSAFTTSGSGGAALREDVCALRSMGSGRRGRKPGGWRPSAAVRWRFSSGRPKASSCWAAKKGQRVELRAEYAG